MDGKVEEDIGEDELEGRTQHFLMGSHWGKLVLHSEILGYEGLGFWREDNL